MTWTPGPLTALSFLSAGILGFLAVIGWRRGRRSATTFVALMIATATWAAVYGVQLGFTTVSEQLPWQSVTLAVSGTVPPILLAFASEYEGESNWSERWPFRVLAAESVVFAVLSLTNGVHHLVWTTDESTTQGVSPVLDPTFSIGYYAHIVVAYLAVAFALWTILSVYLRSSSIYRRQSSLLLAGGLPAFVAHVAYTTDVGPIGGLDLTPFVFVVTGVTFGAALFHFDLLDRTPVARKRAIELTGDGLLVVDAAGLIVDSNRVARQVFGFDSGQSTHVSMITDVSDPRRLHGTTLTDSSEGRRRTYDLYVSQLQGRSGEDAGYSVVLRDVTDRDAYEQRLAVAYRVLRHNLRNEMNVVMGRAELLADGARTDEQSEHAETIRSTVEDLLALSDKARQIVDLDRRTHGEPEVVDVQAVVADVVAEFRAEHPTVPVTVSCPDDVSATVVSAQALTVALANALENAPKHNDTTSLSVQVTVTAGDGETLIAIRDTGSGMPDSELEVFRKGTETPLEHSRGLGLWVIYWVTEHSGGRMTIESSETDGTILSLAFDSARDSTGSS